MVFEGSFNELVEKVWRKKFVDVSSWKSMRERLMKWC
jgi:hypothetical protein